jgi:hypothetical protein
MIHPVLSGMGLVPSGHLTWKLAPTTVSGEPDTRSAENQKLLSVVEDRHAVPVSRFHRRACSW